MLVLVLRESFVSVVSFVLEDEDVVDRGGEDEDEHFDDEKWCA